MSQPKQQIKQISKQRKTVKKPKDTAPLNEWLVAIPKASRRQLNNWLKTVKNLHSGRVTRAIRQRLSERKFERQSKQSNKLFPGASLKRSTDIVSPSTLIWFGLDGKTVKYSSGELHFVWIELAVLPKSGGLTANQAAETLPTRYLTNRAMYAVTSIGSHRKNKHAVTLSGVKQVLKSHEAIPKDEDLTADHLKLETFEQVLKPGDEVASKFGLSFPLVVASKKKTFLRLKIALIQAEKQQPRFIGRLTPLVLAWRRLQAVLNKSDVTMRLKGGSLLVYTLNQQGTPLLKPTLVTAYDSDPEESPDQVEEEEKDSKANKEKLQLQGFYKSLQVTDKSLAIASRKIQKKEQQPKVEKCGRLTLFGKVYDTYLLTASPDTRVTLRLEATVGTTTMLLGVKTWQLAGVMISL
jgi:hypothetical protein